MAARLVVQSGVSAGTVHWIERNVVRVGSSARADMRIPSTEIEDHALTVEFREGSYFVYARSDQPCYLSGQALEPNQPHAWHDSDLVELPGGTQLSLDCDHDPTPGPAPPSTPAWVSEELAGEKSHLVSSANVGEALASSEAEPLATASKKTLQWLVILLCVLGSVGLLAFDQLSEAGVSEEQLSFDSVVRQALQENSEVQDGIIRRLQKAEVSFLRGNTDQARQQYARLHQLLDAATAESEEFKQVAKLVEQRLVRLGEAW